MAQHVTTVVVMVFCTTILLLAPSACGVVYGDPVFTFQVGGGSTSNFYSTLQHCLSSNSLPIGSKEMSVDSSNRATLTFTLTDASDVSSLKTTINDASMRQNLNECLHDYGQFTNTNESFATVNAPPGPPPTKESDSKILEIALPIAGFFVLALIGVIGAIFYLRARNARLLQQNATDLNQRLSERGEAGARLEPPNTRKAAAPKKNSRQVQEV